LNRGFAYSKKGNYDNAIRDYDRALEVNPGQIVAHFNKAIAYEKVGRVKEAIGAYKAFIQNAEARHGQYINHAKQRLKELERK